MAALQTTSTIPRWELNLNIPDVLSSILILGCALALGYRISLSHSLNFIAMSALLLGVFAIGMVFHFPASGWYLASDGAFYSAWGTRISEAWRGANYPTETIWPGRGALPILIAVFEYFIGAHELSMIALGAVATGACFVLLQIAAGVLVSGSVGGWSSLAIFALGGAIPFYGAAILREHFFWLGVSCGTLALVYLVKNKIRRWFLSITPAVLTLLIIRPDFGMVLSVVLVSASLAVFTQRSARAQNIPQALFLSAAIASLLASLPGLVNLVRPIPTADGIGAVTDSLSDSATTTAYSRSLQLEICEINAVIKSLCEIGNNLPRTLFGPFVWEVGTSGILAILFFSTLHTLLVIVLGTYYLVRVSEHRSLGVTLMSITLIGILTISVFLTNYGIIWRFKPSALMFIYPLAFLGWRALSQQVRKNPLFLRLRRLS